MDASGGTKQSPQQSPQQSPSAVGNRQSKWGGPKNFLTPSGPVQYTSPGRSHQSTRDSQIPGQSVSQSHGTRGYSYLSVPTVMAPLSQFPMSRFPPPVTSIYEDLQTHRDYTPVPHDNSGKTPQLNQTSVIYKHMSPTAPNERPAFAVISQQASSRSSPQHFLPSAMYQYPDCFDGPSFSGQASAQNISYQDFINTTNINTMTSQSSLDAVPSQISDSIGLSDQWAGFNPSNDISFHPQNYPNNSSGWTNVTVPRDSDDVFGQGYMQQSHIPVQNLSSDAQLATTFGPSSDIVWIAAPPTDVTSFQTSEHREVDLDPLGSQNPDIGFVNGSNAWPLDDSEQLDSHHDLTSRYVDGPDNWRSPNDDSFLSMLNQQQDAIDFECQSFEAGQFSSKQVNDWVTPAFSNHIEPRAIHISPEGKLRADQSPHKLASTSNELVLATGVNRGIDAISATNSVSTLPDSQARNSSRELEYNAHPMTAAIENSKQQASSSDALSRKFGGSNGKRKIHKVPDGDIEVRPSKKSKKSKKLSNLQDYDWKTAFLYPNEVAAKEISEKSEVSGNDNISNIKKGSHMPTPQSIEDNTFRLLGSSDPCTRTKSQLGKIVPRTTSGIRRKLSTRIDETDAVTSPTLSPAIRQRGHLLETGNNRSLSLSSASYLSGYPNPVKFQEPREFYDNIVSNDVFAELYNDSGPMQNSAGKSLSLRQFAANNVHANMEINEAQLMTTSHGGMGSESFEPALTFEHPTNSTTGPATPPLSLPSLLPSTTDNDILVTHHPSSFHTDRTSFDPDPCLVHISELESPAGRRKALDRSLGDVLARNPTCQPSASHKPSKLNTLANFPSRKP